MRVCAALAAATPGEGVCIKGWVRTVRRGKEVAFIALNDGSCFASIQVVLEPSLANFEEVTRAGTGSEPGGAGGTGRLPGLRAEMGNQGSEVELVGDADAGISAAEKAPHLRVPAHHRPSAPPLQHLRRRLPHAQRSVLCRPPVFPGARLSLRADPDHHRQRLRGGGGDVPGDDPRPSTRPGQEAKSTGGRTSSGRRPGSPSAASSRGSSSPPPSRRLHLRPHLPRRKLQHQPPRQPSSG